MIIVKYVNLILIIIICTYMGFSKSKKFSDRVKNLKDMKNALSIFKSKIEFTYEPIKDIFEEISKVQYQDKENIFKSFNESLGYIQDVTILWNEAVQNCKMYFENADKEILMMLGKMLGKTDKSGQVSEIEMVSQFLNRQIEDAQNLEVKNKKLYKTLGVFVGITIVIILI